METSVLAVVDTAGTDLHGTDVLVLGAPTHARSLSRPASRAEAGQWARGSKPWLTLEPRALERGVRELIDELPSSSIAFVAFGTRAEGSEIFAGSSARAITKRLRRKGLVPLLTDEVFLVDDESRLLDGQVEQAEELGRTIARAAPAGARQHVASGG
jgi:hypothetical protein